MPVTGLDYDSAASNRVYWLRCFSLSARPHPFHQLRNPLATVLPLLPEGGPQASPQPLLQFLQGPRCLAESEVSPPSSHIIEQALQPPAMHPMSAWCQLSYSLLEAHYGLLGHTPPYLRTSRKTEPQKLPLLRSCHCALARIDLELESALQKARNAAHDALPGLLTANIYIAVVRIPHEAVSTSLQLSVQLIQYQIGQQRRQRPALRCALLAHTHQPVFHHSRFQIRPDQAQHLLIRYPLAQGTHQPIVVDSVKELFQVQIHHPSVPLPQVLLGLGHGLMGRPFRSEPVAVGRKRRIPSALQDLQDRLLDQPIQHCGNAQLPHSPLRFGDFHPPHRLRLVSPGQQLFPDSWPVLLQVARELRDIHPVHSRASPVGLH